MRSCRIRKFLRGAPIVVAVLALALLIIKPFATQPDSGPADTSHELPDESAGDVLVDDAEFLGREYQSSDVDFDETLSDSALGRLRIAPAYKRWSCWSPEKNRTSGCGCVNGYIRNFVEGTNFEGTSIGQLEEQLRDIYSGLLAYRHMTNVELPAYLRRETHFDDLESLASLLTTDAYVGEFSEHGHYRRREILLYTRLTGDIRVVHLTPAVERANGHVIIFLHGHSENPDFVVTQYHADEFAARGFDVLIPSLRAICVDAHEDQVSRVLLSRRGIPFLAVQAFELLTGSYKFARLALKAPGERIHLVGHSAGSGIARFFARVVDLNRFPLGKLVVDLNNVHFADYLPDNDERAGPGPMRWSNQMAPMLYSSGQAFYDNPMPVPVLEIPYGHVRDDGTWMIEEIAAALIE